MKPHADRPIRPATAMTLALLICVSLLWVGGCADEPHPGGGVTVSFDFEDGSSVPASADGGTSSPMVSFTGPGEAVRTVVIGAIVVTNPQGSGPGGSYTNADVTAGISDAERESLEQDAEQSVSYIELVQLPTPYPTVSFILPPANAGNWQLVAVGLRNTRANLASITDNDPIWYGFYPGFLNGQVSPGETLSNTLTLVAWCTGNNFPPQGTGLPGCP